MQKPLEPTGTGAVNVYLVKARCAQRKCQNAEMVPLKAMFLAIVKALCYIEKNGIRR